ncbi:MAG: ATP-dependent DNA helicase UvrD2 [Actinomycetota bacterium]
MPEPEDDEMLLGLDGAQRQAVVSSAPLLAVIAGAGSGKTGVLTRRVAHRCFAGHTDPRHVVVLTFTRQAAAELRRRLRSIERSRSTEIEDAPQSSTTHGVMAGTFHAVAYSLLRQYWDDHGRQHPVLIQDRRRLIGEVLGPRPSSDISTIAAEIDWARARNLSAGQYASARQSASRRSAASSDDVGRVMTEIAALKRKRGIIDLDDLLTLTIDTLASDADFAASTRWKLRHFYVDEAQDLNPLQTALLTAWLDDRDDLTLVGDPSQAIFGFNGADPRLLMDLETRFPGIEIVRLSTNYRCTPEIVTAGLAVLSHGVDPVPDLESARPSGAPIDIYGFDDEDEEARGIAAVVSSLRRHQRSWRDIAVLARTNAQLQPIAAALLAAGIPARVVAGQMHDPLRRILREVEDLPSSHRLAAWAKDVWIDDPVENLPTLERPDDPIERGEPVLRRRVAATVEEFLLDGGGDGRSFAAWVRANRPFDADEPADAVELSTFHSAKGREWDHVVVAGCEQGLVPHSSARTPAETHEEIRLAYVALTRAADRLVLTHARNRRGRPRSRSPLIDGADRRDPVVAPGPTLSEEFRRRRSELFPSDPIWDELLRWRETAGRAAQVPPASLCPDDVLRRIADRQPRSVDELETIPGVGAMLARRVGLRILDAVSRGRRVADAPD